MGQPFVGQLLYCGFNFQVNGWNYCNGALIPIAENNVLFTLIGTTYGGDGQQSFALPDLQGRIPVHQGGGYVIGQKAGVETVTLTTQTMPIHNHLVLANSANASVNNPSNVVFGASGQNKIYSDASPTNGMSMGTGPAGNSQPHDNMQPFLVCNWIISLFGVFPTQN